MTVTFHCVTLSFEAQSPQDAYTQMCAALSGIDADWFTEDAHYSVDDETITLPITEAWPNID